jgi:hypothetical protein
MEQATRRYCSSRRPSSMTRGRPGVSVDDGGHGARTEQHGEAGRWLVMATARTSLHGDGRQGFLRGKTDVLGGPEREEIHAGRESREKGWNATKTTT